MPLLNITKYERAYICASDECVFEDGICYICGESIIKDEFRIFYTIVITYTHKYNKRTGKCDSVLRARHKKCNINN